VKGWKKLFQENGPKAVRNSYTHKADFRIKIVRRGNNGHFILTKATNHQEEITILKYMQQTLMCPTTLKHTTGLKSTSRPTQ
jgi:hypothetical protein